jgi:hypothetical protein
MNPIVRHIWTPEDLARYGIRGIKNFSAEELALPHQKVEGWMRQRDSYPERTRRRPGVMTKPRTAHLT